VGVFRGALDLSVRILAVARPVIRVANSDVKSRKVEIVVDTRHSGVGQHKRQNTPATAFFAIDVAPLLIGSNTHRTINKDN
jgi:hypothetical protein